MEYSQKYHKKVEFINVRVINIFHVHNYRKGTKDGVAAASSEGASGTADIATLSSEVSNKSNKVLLEALKAKENAKNLKEEVSKFKI